MATIVNTPAREHYHEETSSSSVGNLAWTVLAVLILALLFFYFGLPLIRNVTSQPQINVPGKIDVNLNNPNVPAPAPQNQ